MSPLVMILLGFALLGVFGFGGLVLAQGRDDRSRRDHVASAMRVFATAWLVFPLGNVWVRWWDGQPLWLEILYLVPVIVVPIAAAFWVWQRLRK